MKMNFASASTLALIAACAAPSLVHAQEGGNVDAIIVTGTKERGHIKLNRPAGRIRAYPPFILFNAERPLELAQLIKTTLKIDQPIEDRTR